MALPSVDVNYLAVFIAAVVSFIFGWLFYGPLFGKLWIKLNRKSVKEIREAEVRGITTPMLLNFLGTILMVYVFGFLIQYASVDNFTEVMQFSFWIWLGFFASTTLLGSVLWDNKSWGLWALNSIYWLLNLIIVGSILISL